MDPNRGSQVLNSSSLSLGKYQGLLETSSCYGIWNSSLGSCNSSYCTVYGDTVWGGLGCFDEVSTLGWGSVCEPFIRSILYHYSKNINKFPPIIFSVFCFSFRGSKKSFPFFPQFLFFPVFMFSRPFVTREGIMIMRKCTIKSGYRK